MSNTSATGGFLSPGTSTVNDDALDDLLQAMVVGVTGLPGSLVRPRFQQSPPKQPDATVDWCAIGVHEISPDDNPVVRHDPLMNGGAGGDVLERSEQLDVLASFYGPHAAHFAGLLRDGLYIPQNRETLAAAGVAFVTVGDKTRAPALVGTQWLNRFDIHVTLRRVVALTYGVQTLLTAGVDIDNEHYLTHISVQKS